MPGRVSRPPRRTATCCGAPRRAGCCSTSRTRSSRDPDDPMQQEGDRLALTSVSDGDGKDLLLAFTENARLESFSSSGTVRSLAQRASGVVAQAMANHDGLAIDAGTDGAFVAYSDEIQRAFGDDQEGAARLASAIVDGGLDLGEFVALLRESVVYVGGIPVTDDSGAVGYNIASASREQRRLRVARGLHQPRRAVGVGTERACPADRAGQDPRLGAEDDIDHRPRRQSRRPRRRNPADGVRRGVIEVMRRRGRPRDPDASRANRRIPAHGLHAVLAASRDRVDRTLGDNRRVPVPAPGRIGECPASARQRRRSRGSQARSPACRHRAVRIAIRPRASVNVSSSVTSGDNVSSYARTFRDARRHLSS